MKAISKTTFIGLCLLGSTITVSAQLKVTSDGTTYLKGDSVYGRTAVNIGTCKTGMTSLSSYYFSTGLRTFAYNTGSTGHCVGVFGEAKLSNDSQWWTSAGLWGVGGGAYTGYNFGTVGTLHTNVGGAGVFGANQDNAVMGLSGNYAGYFYGPVYVVGQVYSTVGFNSPSDMRLKRNILPLTDKERNTGSTLDNLLGLEVLEYNLRTPQQESIAALPDSLKPTGKDPNPDIRHYGVSAQELQKIYPDLVSEGEDGYLSVNYVEMVPLLLRSIQQLSAKVQELEGEDGGPVRKAAPAVTAIAKTTASRAVLYQNTPNPFTAQTEIRFSLPDDAPQAYIYIFDMTGKMQKQIPVASDQQSVTINGYELQAGLYLYSLVVGGQEIDTKRMILSK